MKNNVRRFSLLVSVVVVIVAAPVHAANYKLVANNAVHIESLPKKAVSDLFMKRTTKWESGQAVVPVDQAETAAVRDEFSRDVLGKPTAAVKSYWNQQIFSGREVPPIEKPSDADVLKFIRSTPGAVGYVSESTPTDGVRVIHID